MNRFNDQHPNEPLVTRIGLHVGTMVLEYDAEGGGVELVGDAANAAERIQSLNKQLSAGVLASAAVVSGLADALLLRRLGTFELKGFPSAVTVFEIVGRPDHTSRTEQVRCAQFARALEAFEAHRESEAGHLFERFVEEYGTDGPSGFYLQRCRERRASSQELS